MPETFMQWVCYYVSKNHIIIKGGKGRDWKYSSLFRSRKFTGRAQIHTLLFEQVWISWSFMIENSFYGFHFHLLLFEKDSVGFSMSNQIQKSKTKTLYEIVLLNLKLNLNFNINYQNQISIIHWEYANKCRKFT